MMRYNRSISCIALVFAAILLTGCQFVNYQLLPYADSVIYNRGQRQFPEADRLVFLQKGQPPWEVTDPATIARLANIYSHANWEGYWHTLPGHLYDRQIEVHRDGVKLLTLSPTGELMELVPDSGWETAEVATADREWLESLFPRDKSGEPREFPSLD